MITTMPSAIKKAFLTLEEPATGEIRLWRERAARMTLDALGHTNLTVKPHEHNEAVRYARRWFRGLFDDLSDQGKADDVQATFDSAGVPFEDVKKAVLAEEPIIFEPEEGDDNG